MVDFLAKWKQGLDRTRKVTFGRIANLLGVSDISDETWDDLEAALVQADMGIETTSGVIKALKKQVQVEGLTKTDNLQDCLHKELLNRLDDVPPIQMEGNKPAVILLVGVNGSGKTTTAAKEA